MKPIDGDDIDLLQVVLDADPDNTPMKFGKHIGRTPDEISETHPGYLTWLWKVHSQGKTLMSKALYEYCESGKTASYEDDMDDSTNFGTNPYD